MRKLIPILIIFSLLLSSCRNTPAENEHETDVPTPTPSLTQTPESGVNPNGLANSAEDVMQNPSVIGEIQQDSGLISNGRGRSAYLTRNADGLTELHICDDNYSVDDIAYRCKQESEEIKNIYWLDHEHLFFSGYKDRVYHLDSGELEETDIITRVSSDYFDYGFLNEITRVSENTIIFNMNDRIGKVFFTINDGVVTFSNIDPANPPGTWLNDLSDASFSNLNARGYAADADTYGYTYYSYGDLFHPDLILRLHDGYTRASREIAGYYDEDDCYYLTFLGERLYFSCFWYTYAAEPDEGWEEWDYSFHHGLIRINKDYTNKKVLYEGVVSFLNPYHNDIYFLDEEGNILKINWDDEIETVYKGDCVSLYIKGDYLYYTENEIFYQRSLLDGKTQELLSKPHTYPSVIGSHLYYLTEEGSLMKYDIINQTESALLDSKSLVFYCIYGNGIYYNTRDNPGVILYRNMETREERVVYQGKWVSSFILLGDYLFFQDNQDGYMSIRNDGSEFNIYCDYN